MNDPLLSVKNLTVITDGKDILRKVSFSMRKGEIVGLIGANGSGKSSLALTLAGHPRYKVNAGTAQFMGKNLLKLKPEKRAKLGLFLSFQYPSEISGVPLGKFLFTVYKELHGNKVTAAEFLKLLEEKRALLRIEKQFTDRSVNEGFSGGEKKRAEILQLAILRPRLAILDEADSGLDVESRGIICDGIRKIREENPEMSILLITHYEDFLLSFNPDRVIKMQNGTVGE